MSGFDRLEKLIVQMRADILAEMTAGFAAVDARFDRERHEIGLRFDRERHETGLRFDRERHENGIRFEAVRQDLSLLAEGQAAILEKVERIDGRLTVVEEKGDFIAADTRILRADVAALGSRMDAVELRLPPAP